MARLPVSGKYGHMNKRDSPPEADSGGPALVYSAAKLSPGSAAALCSSGPPLLRVPLGRAEDAAADLLGVLADLVAPEGVLAVVAWDLRRTLGKFG